MGPGCFSSLTANSIIHIAPTVAAASVITNTATGIGLACVTMTSQKETPATLEPLSTHMNSFIANLICNCDLAWLAFSALTSYW